MGGPDELPEELLGGPNELWEFDDDRLMLRREASINDVAIAGSARQFFWPALGARPADHSGIPDLASSGSFEVRESRR